MTETTTDTAYVALQKAMGEVETAKSVLANYQSNLRRVLHGKSLQPESAVDPFSMIYRELFGGGGLTSRYAQNNRNTTVIVQGISVEIDEADAGAVKELAATTIRRKIIQAKTNLEIAQQNLVDATMSYCALGGEAWVPENT